MRLYGGFVCGSNALVITDILQQPGHTCSSVTKIPSSQELERARIWGRNISFEFYYFPPSSPLL